MKQDQSQAKTRSRKLYTLWAIALTLLLALGLFSWLVVVPVWRVSSEINVEPGEVPLEECLRDSREPYPRGDPGTAFHDIAVYVRLPHWIARKKPKAISLLGQCGSEAIPVLERILQGDDDDLAACAAAALTEQAKTDEDAVVLLIAVIENRTAPPRLTHVAIRALRTASRRGTARVRVLDNGNWESSFSVNSVEDDEMPPAIASRLPEIIAVLKKVSSHTARTKTVRDDAADALTILETAQEKK